MNLYGWFSQKANRYLGFSDTWLMIAGIIALAFIMPLIFFGKDLSCGLGGYIPDWLTGVFFVGIFWIGNRTIVILFRRRYPAPSDNRKRVIRQSLAMVAFTVITSVLLDVATMALLSGMEMPMEEMSSLQTAGASLFATLTVASLYEAAYYVNNWKESLAQVERLRKEQLQAQLASLRNQVNPHFLFNSLNTLASLIPEDPGSAVNFVQKLSLVYRHILDIQEDELISLRKELESASAFGFLLSTRFGENLRIVTEVPEAYLDWKVAPLSMQILIENAVKHNIVSSRHPLGIWIRVNDNAMLEVSNTFQKKQQEQEGSGTGLSNIRKRYSILTGEEPHIHQTSDRFVVELPLIGPEQYEGADSGR